jgi:hypothetical protein
VQVALPTPVRLMRLLINLALRAIECAAFTSVTWRL